MLGSCSIQTKLIVRVPHGMLFLNQKEFPIQLAQKKVRSLVVFVRNERICFFHIQHFSKCEEVVQIKRNSQLEFLMVCSFQIQKNFRSTLRRKKLRSLVVIVRNKPIYFLYRAFFIMLGSCPIGTKFIVRVPHGMVFRNQKEFPIQLAQKKVRSLVVFVRNKRICFFHIQHFSKCEEVVQIKRNSQLEFLIVFSV